MGRAAALYPTCLGHCPWCYGHCPWCPCPGLDNRFSVVFCFVRGKREETFLEQLTGGVQRQRVVWSDEDAPCPGTELQGYLP